VNDTHQQFTQGYLRKFVGIPYEDKDSYELVQYFYDDIFGIKLEKLYGSIRPTKKETEQLVNDQLEGFEEVTTPRMGDIMLIRIVGLTCHIGVYIDENRFLHSRQGVGSSLERFDKWTKRIEGYYRCRKK